MNLEGVEVMAKNFIGKTVPANLYRGIEAVGGKILFDKDGMAFEAHKLNIQSEKTFISYKDIVEVKKKNTLGIIPNGLVVIMNNGISYKFVVNKRNNIFEFLNEQRL